MKKSVLVIIGAVLLTIGTAFTSFAGQWKQDAVGWWYQNDDGSYQQNGWFRDTDGKYYYFNQAGYMLANTITPDGYFVDASGAWITGSSASSAQTSKSLSGTRYSFNAYWVDHDDNDSFHQDTNSYQLDIRDVNGDGSKLEYVVTGFWYTPQKFVTERVSGGEYQRNWTAGAAEIHIYDEVIEFTFDDEGGEGWSGCKYTIQFAK